MQYSGFQKLKIISLNPSEEWLSKIDEEFEEYIWENNGIKHCRIDIFFQDNKENIFKYSFNIVDKERGSKSGAIKYINQIGEYQWVTDESQLWDSFKQWEKVLSWQKNGNPVTKWESGSVPLLKEVVAKKAYKIALQGEDDLNNLWKAIHNVQKNDIETNLFFDMDKLFSGDFSELIIPDKDFHVTGFLFVSDKGKQKVHKLFFNTDFMRDVNNNMSISNYNKKEYDEFLKSLEGHYILGKCQEYKFEPKTITKDEGDY